MKRLMLAAALASGIAAAAYAGAARTAASRPVTPRFLAAALADPGRAPHRSADSRRQPGALIMLAGMKPGDRVLDLIPGDGYWTRIFSKVVGPRGKVYAVWPRQYAKLAKGNVATLRGLSASKAYANVVTMVEPTTLLTAPEPLDVVWTSQNYHDYPDKFMGRTSPSVLNRAVFRMLKPGGVFMIIDHAAAIGRGMADTDTLHRIDPAIVKTQVEAAGFRFVGESRVLLNSKDPLNIPVFDKAIRGRTSQFAFKFRKPAK